MNKLFKKITLFSSVLFILFGLTVCLYRMQIQNSLNQKDVVDYLILGDSHSQNGIDPLLLSSNSINLSTSAESYFFCFTKIKYFLENKREIKNLILAYGPHSLSKEVDTIWVKDKINFQEKYRSFYPLISIKDAITYTEKMKLPFTERINIVNEAIYQSLYSIERQILIHKLPYIGGYESNNKHLIDTVSKKTNESNSGYSELQVYYLKQIVALCKEHNVKLFLVNTPLFSGHNVMNPPSIPETDYTLLDYGGLMKGQSKYFADFVHLNSVGAQYFSTVLSKHLNNQN